MSKNDVLSCQGLLACQKMTFCHVRACLHVNSPPACMSIRLRPACQIFFGGGFAPTESRDYLSMDEMDGYLRPLPWTICPRGVSPLKIIFNRAFLSCRCLPLPFKTVHLVHFFARLHVTCLFFVHVFLFLLLFWLTACFLCSIICKTFVSLLFWSSYHESSQTQSRHPA